MTRLKSLPNKRIPLKKYPEYNCWKHIMRRCYNPNNKDYKNYGARGISVCDSWRGSFASFYSDMGKRPIGLILDRIDKGIDLRLGRYRVRYKKRFVGLYSSMYEAISARLNVES